MEREKCNCHGTGLEYLSPDDIIMSFLVHCFTINLHTRLHMASHLNSDFHYLLIRSTILKINRSVRLFLKG